MFSLTDYTFSFKPFSLSATPTTTVDLNELSCSHSARFDLVINHEALTSLPSKKLSFKGSAVKISHVKTKKISIKASFTEIGNSTISRIKVTGSLFLHAFQGPIESIEVSETLFLFTNNYSTKHLEAIKSLKAKYLCIVNDLSIPLDSWPSNSPVIFEFKTPLIQKFSKTAMIVGNIYHYKIPSNEPICYENIAGTMVSNSQNINVSLKGDCSKADIIFTNPSSKVIVTVQKGALFNGEVIGAKLKYEEERSSTKPDLQYELF